MPPQHSVSDIRLRNIVTCLTPAVTFLKDVHDTFGTPFIPAIAGTTLSLMTLVQTVKRNKDECAQLMEKIHSLLYGVINLHMQSGAAGTLPPAMMYHIGKFAETLHKIHAFIEAQQDGNTIKHFFRQSEMSALLKNCHAGLQEAHLLDPTLDSSLGKT
ncbi:hypothetical protein C8R44DRAFT_895302 [Mycena epipterygia]|nr:hypothetical protein C8R44DRAFT_895302 [Mycena epipterygia]